LEIQISLEDLRAFFLSNSAYSGPQEKFACSVNNFSKLNVLYNNVSGFIYIKFLVETVTFMGMKINQAAGTCHIFAVLGSDFGERPCNL
jgi:hypothetical protein